ncbi:MAG: hypothetical protein H6738_14590 [Alphaproteobacteria bacterium]|nr:hypothetical protein [Alphaproteobacteria bacterium]MCB9698003.1 hypothetical protein [Alphaproteobacteria bacterium]
MPRIHGRRDLDETPEERARRVECLRQLWLEGRLDLSVAADADGMERLLDALLADDPYRI